MKPYGYRFDYADWDGDEYLAIIRSLFSDYRTKLQTLLESEFPESDVVLLNSARGGLSVVLEHLRKSFPERQQVLVPGYICPSVPETVERAGLEPVPVEVGEDLNMVAERLEESITDKTLAVICVHMYGKPMAIRHAERVCKAHDLFLIDDAAQLGSGSKDGKAYGSHGDFGLVSFAQSKSIVTGVRGSGGVLLVNSDRGRSLVKTEHLALAGSRGRVAQLLYFYAAYIQGRRFGKMLYYWERLRQRLNLAKQNHYRVGRISNLEAAIAWTQYGTLDERTRNQKEKICAAKRIFSNNSFFTLPQVTEDTYVTRLMLQLNRPEQLAEFRKALSTEGISTRPGYDPDAGMVEIPCKGAISQAEFEQMCDQINRITDRQLETHG